MKPFLSMALSAGLVISGSSWVQAGDLEELCEPGLVVKLQPAIARAGEKVDVRIAITGLPGSRVFYPNYDSFKDSVPISVAAREATAAKSRLMERKRNPAGGRGRSPDLLLYPEGSKCPILPRLG